MINIVITFEQKNLTPVIESFGFESQYYVLSKDTSEAVLAGFLQQFMRHHRKYRAEILLTVSRCSEIRFYKIHEVLYIESSGKRKCINTGKETFEFYGQMYHIERITDKLGFVRVHDAFIVSLRHIRSADSRRLVLDNGKVINIGKKYLAQFREVIRTENYVSLMNRG